MNRKEIESLPVNVVQLIENLDLIFPEQSALLEWTDREVWFRAGQRSVVQWLLELKRRDDNPNNLED
jgi:hypothetical protein